MGYFHSVVAVGCKRLEAVWVGCGSLVTCGGIAMSNVLAGDVAGVVVPFQEESVLCSVCGLGSV